MKLWLKFLASRLIVGIKNYWELNILKVQFPFFVSGRFIMKKINSKIKKKQQLIEKPLIILTDIDDKIYTISDADKIDIKIEGKKLEATMWFNFSRPFDKYYDMKGRIKKITVVLEKQKPVVEYELKKGYWGWLGFYNLKIYGETIEEKSNV